MLTVVFIKRHRAYNSGEQAGFTPDKARELVEAGVAEYASEATVAPAGARADSTTAEERQLEADFNADAGDAPVLGDPEREPEPGAGAAADGKARTSRGRHKP